MKKLLLVTLLSLASASFANDFSVSCQKFMKKRVTQYSAVAVGMCNDVQNPYALRCVMALSKFDNISDNGVYNCLRYNNFAAASAIESFIAAMNNVTDKAVAIIGNIRSQDGFNCVHGLIYNRPTISDNALQACAK